jgi:hypothetical protein
LSESKTKSGRKKHKKKRLVHQKREIIEAEGMRETVSEA